MPASPSRLAIETMRAIAIDRHGGVDTLRLRHLPIPVPGPGQLLLRVHAAGVGRWDVLEREGAFAARRAQRTLFPHVPGSEGAGVVVSTGTGVERFTEGDRVYGLIAHRMPKCGFHAEFTLVNDAHAWPVPARLSLDQAAVIPVDGGIALRGLRDILRMAPGDSLALFGASGGVGHMALQFARGMGVRVLAIASGEDGVRMAQRLGAEHAIDGRRDDIETAVRRFAARGLPAALLTAGGEAAGRIVDALPAGARVAWPHGVEVPMIARDDLSLSPYGGDYHGDTLHAVHALIHTGPFVTHVWRRFPLERIAEAHAAVAGHHLGRIAVSAL